MEGSDDVTVYSWTDVLRGDISKIIPGLENLSRMDNFDMVAPENFRVGVHYKNMRTCLIKRKVN